MANYDAIIIGGGHNGLVCAASLASARKKVLVLEQRRNLGGAAATEEVFPQFLVNTGATDAGLFLPEIIEKFGLVAAGLQVFQSDAAVFAPQPDGTAITLWRDLNRTVSELQTLYPDDAKRFLKFNTAMNKMSQALRPALLRSAPNIDSLNVRELIEWAQPALKIRQLGKKDMMEFLRVLPLSASELLDEWFQSAALKGLLSTIGVTASHLGPRAAGTAFLMLYHYTGRENGGFKSSWFIRGGIGRLAESLAEFARKNGAEIRVASPVDQIFVNDQDEAVGVRLEDGEKLFAKAIISNANPRTTFFDLVGAPYLDPGFVRNVQNIRYRGVTARMNLALKRLPTFTAASGDPKQLSGHIIISPSVDYLERASDAAKYGEFARQPMLDIVIPTISDPALAPEGKHIMNINMQYAPYQLRNGSWESERESLAETIIQTLAEYAPDLSDAIDQQQLITPQDWERDYGLAEGCGYHGQMALDQLMFMRPVAGWGRHRTPIKNLFLCGAGAHPGGGVTGAPGFNAAKEVLRTLR